MENKGGKGSRVQTLKMFKEEYIKYLRAKGCKIRSLSTQRFKKILNTYDINVESKCGNYRIPYYITKEHYERIVKPYFDKKYKQYVETQKRIKKMMPIYNSKLSKDDVRIAKKMGINKTIMKKYIKLGCIDYSEIKGDNETDWKSVKENAEEKYQEIREKVLKKQIEEGWHEILTKSEKIDSKAIKKESNLILLVNKVYKPFLKNLEYLKTHDTSEYILKIRIIRGDIESQMLVKKIVTLSKKYIEYINIVYDTNIKDSEMIIKKIMIREKEEMNEPEKIINNHSLANKIRLNII